MQNFLTLEGQKWLRSSHFVMTPQEAYSKLFSAYWYGKSLVPPQQKRYSPFNESDYRVMSNLETPERLFFPDGFTIAAFLSKAFNLGFSDSPTGSRTVSDLEICTFLDACLDPEHAMTTIKAKRLGVAEADFNQQQQLQSRLFTLVMVGQEALFIPAGIKLNTIVW